MLQAIKDWWHTRFIRAKQKAAEDTGARFYGAGMTIHQTGTIDVEVRFGKVVACWYRCLPLPFKQVNVEESRAFDMERMYPLNYTITGIERKEN